MNKNVLLTPLLLISPAIAAQEDSSKITKPHEIQFSASTLDAFDRSGVHVTHRVLQGGVQLAEHNNTMGTVTVARLGADGKIETWCTSDESAARSWMAGEDRLTIDLPSNPVDEEK